MGNLFSDLTLDAGTNYVADPVYRSASVHPTSKTLQWLKSPLSDIAEDVGTLLQSESLSNNHTEAVPIFSELYKAVVVGMFESDANTTVVKTREDKVIHIVNKGEDVDMWLVHSDITIDQALLDEMTPKKEEDSNNLWWILLVVAVVAGLWYVSTQDRTN